MPAIFVFGACQFVWQRQVQPPTGKLLTGPGKLPGPGVVVSKDMLPATSSGALIAKGKSHAEKGRVGEGGGGDGGKTHLQAPRGCDTSGA